MTREYCSIYNFLFQSRTSDARQLEALRRIGVKLSDDDNSSMGSSHGKHRKPDRSKAGRSDALETLNKDRQPLGDSIQCLPTATNIGGSHWHDGVDRVGDAVKERLK